MDQSTFNRLSNHILSFSEFLNVKNQTKQFPLESDRSHLSYNPQKQMITRNRTVGNEYRGSNSLDFCDLTNKTVFPSSNINTEPTEYSDYVYMLKNNLKESQYETKKAKSSLINLDIDYQRQLKLFEELKANYNLVQERLLNDLKISEQTNDEKTKEINELIEMNQKLQENSDSYQRLYKKMDATAGVLETKLKTIQISNQPDNSVGSDDITKLIEENKKLNQIIALKDRTIQEITNDLKEKEKIFKEITKMKNAVDDYSTQINDMYKEITLRDETIEKMKKALSEKGTTLNGDGYKIQYEEEVKKNLQMKKSFEEISALVQSLIESEANMKKAYEKSLKEMTSQKLNENLLKENAELKKMNQMYASKLEILPDLEKRFAELFHEINLLKDQNKTLKMQISQPDIDNDLEQRLIETILAQREQEEEEEEKPVDSSILDSFNLYSIYQSSLLAFNISKKEYTKITPKGIEDLKANYQIKGSMTYNSFEGLFIVTGKEFNQLFYYSQKKNTLSSIMTFKENHQYGTLLLDDSSKSLLVLSGINNNKVECLSFEETELSYLPSLNQKRAKSSCCFVNSILYVFFGLNDELNGEVSTIEFLDIKSLSKGSKWEILNIKSLNSPYNFINHSVLNLNDKEILVIGGFNQNNKPNENIFFVNLPEKTMGELNHELPKYFEKGECTFNSHSMFRVFLKGNSVCYVNIDDANNVHMLDATLKYELILFSDHSL